MGTESWMPRIGEKVRATDAMPDAELWNRDDLFVIGVRLAANAAHYYGPHYHVTVSTTWPEITDPTDGFYIGRKDEPDHLEPVASLSPPEAPEGLEPTDDEIFGIITIVTELQDADALDKAYPEILDRLEKYGRRVALSTDVRREALEEALEPSGSTKYAYSGEFKFTETVGFDDDGHEINQEITVPWTTIKEIMSAIKARALSTLANNGGQ